MVVYVGRLCMYVRKLSCFRYLYFVFFFYSCVDMKENIGTYFVLPVLVSRQRSHFQFPIFFFLHVLLLFLILLLLLLISSVHL